MMLFPPNLKKNDLILIISPAGAVSPCQLSYGISYLHDFGFRTEEGQYLYHQEGPFAGTDKERASDLQWALDHTEAKAIWMARGGYGTIKCLPKVSWERFVQHPKWIIGFSDITVLHQKLYQLDIPSIHAPMITQFQEAKAPVDQTINLLKGERNSITWKTSTISLPKEIVGQLIGGNLSIIQSLRGTSLDLDYEDKILFIEDVDEYHYHIDRMVENLSYSGILDKINTLIVGSFTMIREGNPPMPYSLEDNLKRLSQYHNFHLILDAPIGHIEENHPIILGSNIKLSIEDQKVTLNYMD
ncbi:LD-carboxypeptidase [Halosquirtibacter xylanolyticus]|uniref:S66 peptidase family protein n=1 Tax=Halosquirtibacter xylanolyticus TaxID=3374599 RepID=UPI003748A591|nr:LD-carboxypeptidase [Prolixibacteraceae bacterium]